MTASVITVHMMQTMAASAAEQDSTMHSPFPAAKQDIMPDTDTATDKQKWGRSYAQ